MSPTQEPRMTTRDGVPAFPTHAYSDTMGGIVPKDGMTLRDYFAAKATDSDIADVVRVYVHRAATRTEAKYIYADMMLAERAK